MSIWYPVSDTRGFQFNWVFTHTVIETNFILCLQRLESEMIGYFLKGPGIAEF